MNVPNVVHPRPVRIGAHLLQPVTYFALTDAQAAFIAQHAFRQRKWTKKQAGKVHQVLWTGDPAALAALEAAAAHAKSMLRDLLGPATSPRRR